MKVDLHNYTILNWLNGIIFLIKLVYNTTIILILKIKSCYAKLKGTSSQRFNSKSEQSMQTNAIFSTINLHMNNSLE